MGQVTVTYAVSRFEAGCPHCEAIIAWRAAHPHFAVPVPDTVRIALHDGRPAYHSHPVRPPRRGVLAMSGKNL